VTNIVKQKCEGYSPCIGPSKTQNLSLFDRECGRAYRMVKTRGFIANIIDVFHRCEKTHVSEPTQKRPGLSLVETELIQRHEVAA
jgi:hypothetical protein